MVAGVGKALLVLSIALVLLTAGTTFYRSASAQIIAPVTSVAIAGTQGSNGWYTSDVTVILNGSDYSNTGLSRTEFSFNASQWVNYTAPIVISNEGKTGLYYRSIDNASNVETYKMLIVSIDKTPPTITVTMSPAPDSNGWSNQSIRLRFDASDSISGISWSTPEVMLTNEGTYSSLTGIATNNAGISAGVAAPGVNIDKTPPQIGNITAWTTAKTGEYVTAKATYKEENPGVVQWDWADGTRSDAVISEGVAVGAHAYKYPGSYAISLNAVDKAGNVGRSGTIILITSPTPTETATPAPTPMVTSTPVPAVSATPAPAPAVSIVLSLLAVLVTGIVIGRRKMQ